MHTAKRTKSSYECKRQFHFYLTFIGKRRQGGDRRWGEGRKIRYLITERYSRIGIQGGIYPCITRRSININNHITNKIKKKKTTLTLCSSQYHTHEVIYINPPITKSTIYNSKKASTGNITRTGLNLPNLTSSKDITVSDIKVQIHLVGVDQNNKWSTKAPHIC